MMAIPKKEDNLVNKLDKKFHPNFTKLTNKLKNEVDHILNPLHIYCKLCDLGLSEKSALKYGNLYEKYIWKHISK